MTLNPDQFSYRGNHRPASPGDGEESTGAPLHDIEQVMPDFYRKPHYYDFGEAGVRESMSVVQRARGNPDFETTIYRSVPSADMPINPGDWVTLSKTYAQQHGQHADDPSQDWPVVEGRAKASELWTSGDSVNEWGYHPQ